MSLLYNVSGSPLLVRGDVSALNVDIAIINGESVLVLSGGPTTTNLGGCQSLTIQVQGTYVGTLTVEGTVDGANYVTMPVVIEATGVTATVLASAATGVFSTPCAGFSQVRVRATAFTSGAATVSMVASVAPWKYGNWGSLPSVLNVTATGAAGAAATCTLPGVAGLCHYVTSIHIERLYSALGVAAAAPNIVTTTNIPGTPSWNFSQAARAQGELEYMTFVPTRPVRSTTLGTNTTIVCPVQAQTLWRVTAHYYLGP